MPRPTTPLIEREAVLDAALELIDEGGIEWLSIRRLAQRLGVNGASLYYHFANKEAILVEAADLAMSRTPLAIPDLGADGWRAMLLSGCVQLVDLLHRHPGLTPIMIRRHAVGFRARAAEVVARRLVEAGVSEKAVGPMFDALERLVIGWAVREQNSEGEAGTTVDAKVFEIAAIGIMDAFARSADSAHDRT